MTYPDTKKSNVIQELLDRGTVEVIDRPHLQARLERGEKLRVKLGIDPSGTDLHLGHAVVLRKIRQFQNAGHTVVLIIGDWTARIGDPSGRKETRPPLSPEQVKENAKKYLEQIALILDLNTIEVRWQSEWFDRFTLQTIIELAARFTVQRLLERDDFKSRIQKGIDVRYHEPLYCLLQGYDSVPIQADLELGGHDQLFNVLKGREVQQIHHLPPQDVLTVPLLIGLDGKDKMGKSLNNYIALADTPDDMFGKIMSIPDHLIIEYFTLATDVSFMEIQEMARELKQGGVNPRDLKARLAREIVTLYHGGAKATEASQEFDRIFKGHELPVEMQEVRLASPTIRPDALLLETKLASSRSEAQRLIRQGGLKVAGIVVVDWGKEMTLHNGDVVQVGKRKFVRMRL
ncbi:MAG: tyrosine--tRNA ligase [Patescibacteria group bacterium]